MSKKPMMTGEEILALPMDGNDAKAATVHDYLRALLHQIWEEGECFSGKRPFGNSGWDWELFTPLVKAGAVAGEYDEDDGLQSVDETAANEAIATAIDAM